MFLRTYLDNGGTALIPPSHFVVNPRVVSELQLETDLNKLPQEIGACILMPTFDPRRRDIEARGFFPKEGTPQITLMQRVCADGALYTGDPRAFVVDPG